MSKKIEIEDFDMDFLDMDEGERPKNVRPYVKESSFESIGTNEQKQPTGKKLMLVETVVDRFCTKRTRVTLTPSMCQMRGCGFDAAAKYGGWEFVTAEHQPQVIAFLEKHSKLHSINEEHIVDEGMLDNKWLQSAKGI